MAPTVTRQKRHLTPFESTENDFLRWRTERRIYFNFPYISQARYVVEPAAANDSNFCLLQNDLLLIEKRVFIGAKTLPILLRTPLVSIQAPFSE
jgi:hypothetical protein